MNETFKLRAECQKDVEDLIVLLPKGSLLHYEPIYSKTTPPDMEFMLILKDVDFEKIKNYIRSIEDSHVMLQTVQPLENYTGNRDYNIS